MTDGFTANYDDPVYRGRACMGKKREIIEDYENSKMWWNKDTRRLVRKMKKEILNIEGNLSPGKGGGRGGRWEVLGFNEKMNEFGEEDWDKENFNDVNQNYGAGGIGGWIDPKLKKNLEIMEGKKNLWLETFRSKSPINIGALPDDSRPAKRQRDRTFNLLREVGILPGNTGGTGFNPDYSTEGAYPRRRELAAEDVQSLKEVGQTMRRNARNNSSKM